MSQRPLLRALGGVTSKYSLMALGQRDTVWVPLGDQSTQDVQASCQMRHRANMHPVSKLGHLEIQLGTPVRAIHTPVLFQGFYLPLLSQITVPRSSVGKRCLGGWVRDHGRAALTLVASDRRVGNHHIADGYRDLDLVDATDKRPLGDSAKSADSI